MSLLDPVVEPASVAEPPAAPDPVPRLPRIWPIGIFLVTLIVYAIFTNQVLIYTNPPTGDQPFYLQYLHWMFGNWDGGHYDFMRRVLASERGGELYRKRQPMIEPVFAQMKFNRGLDRFRRRGRGAVRTEWRLITATHNLLKLHRHALAAT